MTLSFSMNAVDVPTGGGGIDDDTKSIHQHIPVQSIKLNTSTNTLEVKDGKGDIHMSLTFPNQAVLSALMDAIDVASATTAGGSSGQDNNEQDNWKQPVEDAPKPIKFESDPTIDTEPTMP